MKWLINSFNLNVLVKSQTQPKTVTSNEILYVHSLDKVFEKKSLLVIRNRHRRLILRNIFLKKTHNAVE